MHPLSWNIYGGHVDNVKMLLEHGANVNLDIDSMNNIGKVTVLDIVQLLIVNEDGDDRFRKLEAVLQTYDAKTFAELENSSDGEEL
jgi:ankyrin repeat protein